MKYYESCALKAFLVMALSGPAVGLAQQSTEDLPDDSDISGRLDGLEQDTRTSTEAETLEDPDRPRSGPGSILDPAEHEPLRPPTAQEVDAAVGFDDLLSQREEDLAYFKAGAESFAQDLKERIVQAYEEQKAILALQYDKAIEELEEQERSRRLEAIARFEAFIEKYPSDPVYTPDAMFRLAELYFEKSSDDYLLASRAYEEELLAFDEGRRTTEPDPPLPNYEQTVNLHRELLRKFPNYRLADGARYLLGYAYSEQEQVDEALLAYQELVARHPESDFLPEVWTRIGEIYFDRDGEQNLENAVAAYSEVKKYPESPFYDKALYKIAWTYYRLDRFQNAVDAFIELIAFADRQEELTGESGSELRAEALQYVAISLADDEWGGFDKAKVVLSPLEDKPYAPELWRSYGEVLFEQTRYEQSIQVLRYTLQKYPNETDNPAAQDMIVRAHEQLRDFDGATLARERLVENFSKDSAWYVANAGNEEALRKAESLAERSLYTAAIFRHQQAQAYKRDGLASESRQSYMQAADAYKDYLNRFPKSSNAYDFEFYLAECLFYSQEYRQAADQYAAVRDSTVNNKYVEAAALSAVITHEKLVEENVAQGKIPEYPVLTADQRSQREVQPREIAPLRQDLVAASDRYLTLIPDGERAPAIAYRAAEVFYRHDQFPEARRRFEEIVAKHPGSEVSRYASNLIIESYLAVEDWEAVETVSNRLIATAGQPSGGSQRDEFVSQLQVFKVGAQFKQAEKFDSEGRFEEAATTYVRLVDENPEHEFADKALFNAAIAYEKVKLFDSASQVYRRIYDKYPRSELAPRALFRQGINAEKGFDFDNAVQAYDRLIERYPDSDNRADAMYNLAVVLENTQDYQKAAEVYQGYAIAFPKRDDSGEVFFRSALVYEKLGNYDAMISTLQQFIEENRRSKTQRERVVLAHQKIGDAEKARGRARRSETAYEECVTAFRRSKLSIKSRAGGYAAECELQVAEAKFRRYDALSISGTGRAQVRALRAKAKSQQEVEQAYQKVFPYKRVEPTLAASYRIGHTYERFAESLFTAPIPPEFENDEELALEYKAQLEDRAAVLERKAEGAYRKAYEEAKRTRVTNAWTERIQEGLNKYAPSEFPIQKKGKAAMQTVAVTANGLAPLAVAEQETTSGSEAAGENGPMPEDRPEQDEVSTEPESDKALEARRAVPGGP